MMTNQANGKWGIVYCPKVGVMMPSAKRWTKIEQCLKEQQVDYDYVQSENTGSVERLVKMYINLSLIHI